MRTPAIAIPRLIAAVMVLAAALPLPATARDFIQDQAGMFSASTIAQLNARISNFNAQTGKEIVVVTVPSLDGTSLQSAASSAFSSQNVNGVLIFIAKNDRRDIVVPDNAGVQSGWFTSDVTRGIRQAMEAQFRTENYDAGITAAVDGVLNVYRAHTGSVRSPSNAGYARAPATASSGGGFHISMFWWIIIAIVGFMILRSVLRAMSGPRYYGGAPGAGAPGPMPGYGGYGYGGGGGFFSGLLGGLGGAWLGNEIFGQHAGGGMVAPADASQMAQGGGWGGNDGGGWQSDAGQAGLGGASAGDWSGGGFGGDSGGGFGGGDVGGGGGDSGGGW